MDLELSKLKIVFNRLSEPISDIDGGHLKKLLDFIRKQESSTPVITKKTILYMAWIQQTLDDAKVQIPTTQQLSLLFELIAILNPQNEKFLLLHSDGIIPRSIDMVRCIPSCDEEVYVSYFKMLRSLTTSKLGKEWLISSLSLWSNVFDVNQRFKSPVLTQALAQFLGDLYLEVAPLNNQFLIDIWHIFLKPFYDVNTKVNTCMMVCQSETDLYNELSPTLCLLHEICLYLSKNIQVLSQWNSLYSILFSFQKLLYTLLKTATAEQFSLELSQAIIPQHFLEIAQFLKTSKTDFRPKYVKHLIRSLQINTSRLFLKNSLQLLNLFQIYWNHVYRIMKLERYEFNFDFEKEILLIRMMPLIELDMRILGREVAKIFENGDYREEYIDACCSDMDKTLVHFWYKLRDTMNPKVSINEEAILSLDYLTGTKDLLSRNNVIILIKYCLYTIEDLVDNVNKTQTLTSHMYDTNFLEGFLDVFILFVEDFDLNWRDGIEIIQMLTRVIDFLQIEELSDNLVIRTLKLVNISISRYLSPDLALLMDSNDPTLGYIGPLLYAKIRDSNSRVRNEAIKVFYTLAKNAKSKYPYFKRIIINSDLHKTTMKILFSKDDADNRKNAAKCLQEIVLVEELWSDLLNTPNLLTSLLDLFKMEPNDTVKTEMIPAISIIYKEDYFTPKNKEELFDIMVTLGKFSRNVDTRIQVLHFWDSVLEELLYGEGMIDGVFPEYTFSKEMRKIIRLDKQEISKRLRRVLSRLSEIGCLTVISQLRKTELDRERTVVETLVNKIKAMVIKYRLNIEEIQEKQCKSPASSTRSDITDMSFEDTMDEQDIYPQYVTVKEFLMDISEEPHESSPLEFNNDFVMFLDQVLGY